MTSTRSSGSAVATNGSTRSGVSVFFPSSLSEKACLPSSTCPSSSTSDAKSFTLPSVAKPCGSMRSSRSVGFVACAVPSPSRATQTTVHARSLIER